MKDVSEDEADDVRALLDSHHIDYFETQAGNWGISMPALWIADEALFESARDLIDTYQADRSTRLRAEYVKNKQTGDAANFKSEFLHRPFQFIAYWILIAVVLFISIYYFVTL